MGGKRDSTAPDEPARPTHQGEGNYLGKARRNFYLSNRCWKLMHELALEYGINHSNVLELAVREMYARVFGKVPPISYVDGRAPK